MVHKEKEEINTAAGDNNVNDDATDNLEENFEL